MAAWQAYVDNLMADGLCQDVAIVGCEDKYVWAAFSEGNFSKITAAEIEALVGKDRQTFFTNGLHLGLKKCSVLRDNLLAEQDWTMDIRTKSDGGGPTYNIAVAKTVKALVILMGKDGVHGGKLNQKAHTMATYLRTCNY